MNSKALDYGWNLCPCAILAWHGTKVDENLIDAILLNTTRLGHAYALASHPLLAEQAKEAGIAVESCPISNQVMAVTSAT